MPTVRGNLVLLCAAAALLSGCAGPRVTEEAPPGVNLAGAWKLDHAASDDPQKILAHMREQALKIIGRQAQQPVLSTPAHPGRNQQAPAQKAQQGNVMLPDHPRYRKRLTGVRPGAHDAPPRIHNISR